MTGTAVVIGGASGIGWATAQTLAADGYTVTIADRNADGAREPRSRTGRTAHRRQPSTSPTRTRCAALFEADRRASTSW